MIPPLGNIAARSGPYIHPIPYCVRCEAIVLDCHCTAVHQFAYVDACGHCTCTGAAPAHILVQCATCRHALLTCTNPECHAVHRDPIMVAVCNACQQEAPDELV
jgi:hypothetical protein